MELTVRYRIRHVVEIAILCLVLCIANVQSHPRSRSAVEVTYAGTGSDSSTTAPNLDIALTKNGSDTLRFQYEPEWIDFPEHALPEQKRQQIRESVKEVIRQKKIFTPEDVRNIDRNWQQYKENQNENWMDEFFGLEREFQKDSRDFLAQYQRRTENDGIIEAIKQEIKTKENELEFDGEKLEQFKQSRQKLDKDFEVRLANIPISGLYMARVKYSIEEVPDSFAVPILLNVVQAGIGDIIGKEIRTLSVIENNVLIRNAVAQIEEGVARVSDSYKGPKFIADDQYYYEFLRVEVYPFDKKRKGADVDNQLQNASAPSQSVSDRVEVYRLNPDSTVTRVRVGLNSTTSTESGRPEPCSRYQLSSSEYDFANKQLDAIKSLRKKVEERIENYKNEYNKDRDEFDTNISRLQKQYEALNNESRELTRRLATAQGQQQILSDMVEASKLQYQTTKKKYRTFYENKIGYVNKTVQAVPTSSKSPLEQFADMTDEAISVIDDLRKAYSKTTVFVESSEKSQTMLTKMEQRDISYVPELRKFTILYFTRSNIGGGNFLLNVNMAFQVRWKARSSDLRFAKDTLFDYEHQRIWMRYPDFVTCEEMQKNVPLGCEIPTMKDLMDLNQAVIDYRETGDVDVFVRMKWPVEDGSYWTKDEMLDEQGHKKIRAYNFGTKSEDLLISSQGGYVLWMKKMQ